MDKTRTLLEFHDLKVEVERTPARELVDHMHSTLLGTPGGLQYRHLDLKDRLNEPGENFFMYLRKSGKMLGSVGFVGRHTRTGGLNHDGWMIRYFSIKAPMRSIPRKRISREEMKDESKRSSVLGSFIKPVFAHPGQLRGKGSDRKEPSMVYALIETKNLRSMNFSQQMGMETVSQVTSFAFSRLAPRISGRLEQIPPADHEEMRQLLKEHYAAYMLYFEGPLFRNDDYYVIREKGEIVAGVQTWNVRWQVVDLGSKMANVLVRGLTSIPWVKKRFNLEELKLLAFDQVYCAPGHEEALYELLEGVMALKKRYLGIFMLDRESHINQIFEKRKKKGLLYNVLGDFNAEVRVRFNNIPEEVKQEFQDKPVFIPTFDNS